MKTYLIFLFAVSTLAVEHTLLRKSLATLKDINLEKMKLDPQIKIDEVTKDTLIAELKIARRISTKLFNLHQKSSNSINKDLQISKTAFDLGETMTNKSQIFDFTADIVDLKLKLDNEEPDILSMLAQYYRVLDFTNLEVSILKERLHFLEESDMKGKKYEEGLMDLFHNHLSQLKRLLKVIKFLREESIWINEQTAEYEFPSKLIRYLTWNYRTYINGWEKTTYIHLDRPLVSMNLNQDSVYESLKKLPCYDNFDLSHVMNSLVKFVLIVRKEMTKISLDLRN